MKLYVPSDNSGVTTCGGFDMKERKPDDVACVLIGVGVPKETANKISRLCGLKGDNAKQAIKDAGLSAFVLTKPQAEAIFLHEYQYMERECKRITTKADVEKAYGKVAWDKLDERIKAVLVCCLYRGDLVAESRKILMPHAVKNDISGFRKALDNPWFGRVPPDRMKRIKEFLPAPV